MGRGNAGPWRVNRDLNQLELDGQVYKLRPRTMDLLVYLAERPDRVISMDDLLTGDGVSESVFHLLFTNRWPASH